MAEILNRIAKSGAEQAQSCSLLRLPHAMSRPYQDTMSAAVLAGPGRIEICKVPKPIPKSHEVRVRVEGCGVCASNLEPWHGRPWFKYPFMPGAPGHEAYGWVDAVGDGPSEWRTGDRVAMLSHHAYAEYDVAPGDALIRIPPELEGKPLPGEPLACAMNVAARAGLRPDSTVAIIGIGFLGAALTQLAVAAGARVIALSRRAYALEIARDFGAEHTHSLEDPQAAIARVKELTDGRWCDVVIEAVGRQIALDIATEITGERGRLVVAGYHQDGTRQINMQLWNWRGIDVINAHERDPAVYVNGMRQAVEAVRTGRLKSSPLCTHRFALDQLGSALDHTRDRPDGFMKAIIAP